MSQSALASPRATPCPVDTATLASHYSVTPRTIANWRARGLPHIRITARSFRYYIEQVERYFGK